MITTRRQIVNEQDRYGGYASQPTSRLSPDIDMTEDIRSDEFVRYSSRRTDRYAETEKPETYESEIRYSGRPGYSDITEYERPVQAPARASAKTTKKRVPRESEDVMPSIKTRAYATERPEEVETVKRAEKSEGMSSKAKIMLAVYVATVIVLAAIVIATGVAISGAENSVSSLEYELGQKNAIILSQQSDLSALGNDTYLTGAAVEQGMKKIENANEVDMIELTNPVEYDARTNWFDKFCDWLSKIIGG